MAASFIVGEHGALIRQRPRGMTTGYASKGAVTAQPNPSGEAFTQIGAGLPLTVEIAHVYTGKYPHSVFGGSKPLLLTSAIKNLSDTSAAAEAVNYLINSVQHNTHFTAPSSDQQGTKLVCYVPAVTAVSTDITLNLTFENFPDQLFTNIGQLFSGAQAIPLFLTNSPYIVGAGTVLKLVQDIGDALLNGNPDFTTSFSINFSDIGVPTQAGYQVFFKKQDDPSAAVESFTFDWKDGLIDPATKKAYKGDAPYIVIALDGTQRDSLKAFAPLVASADLLKRFFNITDGGSIPVADILNVVKAYNDIHYGKDVIGLKKQIATAPAGTDTSSLERQLDAELANIQDPDLMTMFKNN